MRTLIVGMGEVGSALYEVLKDTYDVYTKDVDPKGIPPGIEIMHVCMRYTEDYEKTVNEYISRYNPRIVDICTTVPVGTTAKFGMNAVHSTTRGLHPNLASGLRNITKHIGGPLSDEVKEYFEKAGVRCISHATPETTELAHILNNVAYGVNLVLADEMQKICRQHGVDYYEAVMKYTETNNEGYCRLGNGTKVRPVLTPPNGKIGGHCVTMSANLLPEKVRGTLIDALAKYNIRGAAK